MREHDVYRSLSSLWQGFNLGATFLTAAFTFAGLFGESRAAAHPEQPWAYKVKHRQCNLFSEAGCKHLETNFQ